MKKCKARQGKANQTRKRREVGRGREKGVEDDEGVDGSGNEKCDGSTCFFPKCTVLSTEVETFFVVLKARRAAREATNYRYWTS